MLYYHHRTPQLIQKDVAQLSRLPNHLSVILELDERDRVGGLDTLIDDVAEIACWCASAGVPLLSVYERTGGFLLVTFSLFLHDSEYIPYFKNEY